jgi:hypothetical protein
MASPLEPLLVHCCQRFSSKLGASLETDEARTGRWAGELHRPAGQYISTYFHSNSDEERISTMMMMMMTGEESMHAADSNNL